MDRSLKIMLVDDEKARLDMWRRQLEGLTALSSAQISEESDIAGLLQTLGQRRQAARSESLEGYSGHPLDETDVLVIDHDLGALSSSGAEIAYLARCYSACAVIVLLNWIGEEVFDLHLHPTMELFADVEIGSQQLRNSGLWSPDRPEFRPWGWPILPDAVAQFHRRVASAQQSLDDPFVASVGLEEDDANVLPRAVVDQLWKGSPDKSKELGKITFRELAEPGMGIVRRKDVVPEHALPRVLASRVGTWFEGFIVGGQDVLVDAPHLAARYPSLFGVTKSDHSRLDRTVTLRWSDPDVRSSPPLADALCQDTGWLSRPVWRWRRLQSDTRVAEVSNPFDVFELPVVFCEDRSAFLPVAQAKSFKADLGTPFDRRWIGGRTTEDDSGADLIYLPADRLL